MGAAFNWRAFLHTQPRLPTIPHHSPAPCVRSVAGNITDLLAQQGALTLDGNKVEMGEVSVAGCSQVVKGTNYKVSGTLLAPCHKPWCWPWMDRERLGTHLSYLTVGSGGQKRSLAFNEMGERWPDALPSLPTGKLTGHACPLPSTPPFSSGST